MVEVSNLSYQYSSGTFISFPDFSVESGKHCLLLGESGTGKTTLLHLLGGLQKVQNGSIMINKTDIKTLSESALDRFRGKNIGFVFQRNHLISSLSVIDNVLMAPYLAHTNVKRDDCEEMLAKLGLAHKIKSKITELSHGQQQRVAIARAVVHKPSVILADEPTSALDDTHCAKVIELLLSVSNTASIIIATHDHRLKSYIKKEIPLTTL